MLPSTPNYYTNDLILNPLKIVNFFIFEIIILNFIE